MSWLDYSWNQLRNMVGTWGGGGGVATSPTHTRTSFTMKIVSVKMYAKTTLHWSPTSSMVVLKTQLVYPCYVLAAVTGAAQLRAILSIPAAFMKHFYLKTTVHYSRVPMPSICSSQTTNTISVIGNILAVLNNAFV